MLHVYVQMFTQARRKALEDSSQLALALNLSLSFRQSEWYWYAWEGAAHFAWNSGTGSSL